jgi:heme exporter protein A
MSGILLSAQSLSCERSWRLLFSDIQFQLSAGEVLRIAGPNGAGKSTLLKVLAGISSDYTGDIFWRGQPMRAARDDFHRESLFLGHNKAVKTGLTVSENLLWFQSLYPCHAGVSIASVLAHVDLAAYEHTLCSQLSAGQQQRVALARLLLSEARLWMLDEPFTAVDKQGVADFERMIGEFVELGGAVIMTTHHALQLPVPVKMLELGSL